MPGIDESKLKLEWYTRKKQDCLWLSCLCVTAILIAYVSQPYWVEVKVEVDIEAEVDLRLRLKWGWDEVESKFSWNWVEVKLSWE